MNSHTYANRFAGRCAVTRTLSPGTAVRVDGRRGVLHVLQGRVWLTRAGRGDDEFLDAGDSLVLAAHDAAVIESGQRAGGARVQWLPSPRVLPPRRWPAAIRLGAWRGLAGIAALAARFLDGARLRLDALARKAASSASNAQGSICAGESMA